MERSAGMTSIDVIATALEPMVPDMSRMSSPDGAVTLMLSDIADAESAAERIGAERWEQVLRDHHLLVKRLLEHHDGQVAKFEHDGFLASFNSAHGGLHAAIELQQTFGGADGAGHGQGLALRIGLHSGFVISNPGQLLGRNMVLAARIASRAAAGEILVSSALKQYTENDPSFQFELHGEYHFKGVLGEHTLYRVRWQR